MNPKKKLSFSPLQFFIKNHLLTSTISVILTLAFLNLVVSCSYYNVKDLTTKPETIAKQLDDFNKAQSYIVIHSGEETWHLNNVVLNEEDKTLFGIAQSLTEQHIPIKPREYQKSHRYKSNQFPLNEVHLKLNTNEVPVIGSQVIIPFTDIISISVNDKNTGKSIITALMGIIGVIAVIFIIIALTKSSCPFVYVKQGGEFKFVGELYPGVLTENQQRDDYLLLPNIESINDEYAIKITNELKEIQHTDFVQLIVVEHPENSSVLIDKAGTPHMFTDIIPPNKVVVDKYITDTTTALGKDNISYLFNTDLEKLSSVREIELEFERPIHSNNANLYVVAKNSMWLDYIYGKFNEKFGSYYQEFQKDQQLSSNEKTNKWIDEQHIPLSVYLKTHNGWEFVDKISTVGPMASRDLVIPIDISDVKEDKIQIKLETGFMFWEVDYVGIDYSEQMDVQLNYINPSTAIDQNNTEVTSLLTKADKNYLTQPNVGDQVNVTFKFSSENPDLKQTVYLKNRGFYNYIRDYSGEPNFSQLKLFKDPEAFTDFSKYEYEAIIGYSDQFDLTVNNE